MRKTSIIIVTCLIVMSLPVIAFAAKTHLVKKSETLSSLAKKYHVSVAEIKSVNGFKGSQVKSGTKIIIPAAENKSAQKNGSPAQYTVKKGDTIHKISKKTGVSVFDIKRLNTISKNRVKPGRVLALKEAADVEEQSTSIQTRQASLKLRHPELLKGSDSQADLEELIEKEIDPTIDFSKSAEIKPENMKLLKKAAYSFLGTRYRFGGSSRNGLDCSSFVQHVFREMDVKLPRTAREQFEVGNRVTLSSLQKGDLVFFRTYASFPSHVGIYLGNNKMIHASSRDRRVVVSSLDTQYYRSRYIGAKRIEKINPSDLNLDELTSSAETEIIGNEEQNDTLGLTLESLSQID